jgi:nitrate/TMAO reductase-like tetraheme cytochrome c subunit
MMTLLMAVALVAVCGAPAMADDLGYITAAKCKMCHKLQYTSWEGLAHAKAFDQLKGDEQGNAECLECHATGGSADMPGVQCEACHGPGGGYKSMKVMKDRDASVAAGLIIPDEATCKGCHEGAPHDQVAFNYGEFVKKGVHEHKE